MAARIDQQRRLAERAEVATEWREAARLYEAALSEPGVASSDEAAMLIALGRCYRCAGEPRSAWRTLMRAIGGCRDRGDATAMASATLEALRIWAPPERLSALANDALAALSDGEPCLRARLLMEAWRPQEAERIASEHGCADVLEMLGERRAWEAIDHGRIDEALPILRAAHATYVRMGDHERAAGALRNAGHNMLSLGRLDEGEALAAEAAAYARGAHLLFSQQLAALDVAGVAFARSEFDRCRSVLDEIDGDQDFRLDLYRMWMVEETGGDALPLMPSPERGGGSPGAMSQVHAGRAGVLWRAGRHDAARYELEAWATAARSSERFAEDAPALLECIAAIGDDALVSEIDEACQRWQHVRYSTLQGRGVDAVRGAMALRGGRTDDAERWYRHGREWAERERCFVDAGRCLAGLATAAKRAGRAADARALRERAASAFARAGATMHLAALRRGVSR